jgi:uncharacterized protein (DUF305 family)
MLKIIIVCILVIAILICLIHGSYENDDNNKNYPCNEILKDDGYLDHMITHHEVAVNMSKTHLQHTTNPLIIDILIDVIRVQTFQIHLMESSKPEINSNKNTTSHSYRYTQGDFTKPNTPYISNTYCDPSFFDASHSKNLHKMTDIMYIQHMIPHHQVAIDMSKRILESTNNNFIIDLAYKIIYSQQLEIFKLSELLKSKNMFESTIL